MEPPHAKVQNTAALLVLYHFLNKRFRLRLLRQLFQAENGEPFAFVPQSHVTGGLVYVSFQTSCSDIGTLCQQIGKDLDHQILGVVNIAKVAVYV